MSNYKNRDVLPFAAAAFLVLSPLPALAVGAPLIVRGTITGVDGNTVNLKEKDGSAAKIELTNNASVVSVAKAKLSDIKPGDYIGTAATPRVDGTLQAIEVHIFPKALVGAGEGNRPWDMGAKSSMTNGTVAKPSGRVADNKVDTVTGDTITVDYNGGSKKVLIMPSTKVVSLVVGNRGELKPEATLVAVGVTKNADGSYGASRVTVGTKDLPPPM